MKKKNTRRCTFHVFYNPYLIFFYQRILAMLFTPKKQNSWTSFHLIAKKWIVKLICQLSKTRRKSFLQSATANQANTGRYITAEQTFPIACLWKKQQKKRLETSPTKSVWLCNPRWLFSLGGFETNCIEFQLRNADRRDGEEIRPEERTNTHTHTQAQTSPHNVQSCPIRLVLESAIRSRNRMHWEEEQARSLGWGLSSNREAARTAD